MIVLAQVLWMSEAFQLLVIEVLAFASSEVIFLYQPRVYLPPIIISTEVKESITILTIKLKVTVSTLGKSK